MWFSNVQSFLCIWIYVMIWLFYILQYINSYIFTISLKFKRCPRCYGDWSYVWSQLKMWREFCPLGVILKDLPVITNFINRTWVHKTPSSILLIKFHLNDLTDKGLEILTAVIRPSPALSDDGTISL